MFQALHFVDSNHPCSLLIFVSILPITLTNMENTSFFPFTSKKIEVTFYNGRNIKKLDVEKGYYTMKLLCLRKFSSTQC